MINCLDKVVDPYETILYSPIFSVCYYACMKIGEAVLSTEVTHMAFLSHLTMALLDDGSLVYLLYMPSSKQSKRRKPTLRLGIHSLPACLPSHYAYALFILAKLTVCAFILQTGWCSSHLHTCHGCNPQVFALSWLSHSLIQHTFFQGGQVYGFGMHV